MTIDIWISNGQRLIGGIVSLLQSPAIFNLIVCLLLLVTAKIFKDIVGG